MIDRWARIIELERRQKQLEYQKNILKDRLGRLRQSIQSISSFPPDYQQPPPTGGGGDPATVVLWLATDNQNPNTDDEVDVFFIPPRVAVWFDRSNNLYELGQSVVSSRPLWGDLYCNDNFMVNFDGSDDSLSIYPPTPPGGLGLLANLVPPFTYLFVTRQADTGDSDEWYFRGGNDNWGGFRAITGGSFRMDNGAQISGGTRSTACRIFECIYDGADSSLVINGVTVATGNTGANEPDNFTIGHVIGGGETASNVFLGEHFIFQGRLTTSQRTTYYNALKTKFDITF